MATPPTVSVTSAAFASELVKLLVQVAWADHEVAPEEAEILLRFARQRGLPQHELDSLSGMLRGRTPLTPPNLGVLKNHRAEVIRAVKELLICDLSVAAEEEELLEQITVLLG